MLRIEIKETLARIRTSSAVRALGSLRVGLAALLALFVLVLAGTLYQSEYGLYAAQQKFFHAWITSIGPIPVPGAQLVLSVLAVNLLVSTLFRIRFTLKNAGLILIHFGLILLVAGAFQAHLYAEESLLALGEGEESSAAHDPRRYQLIVRTESGAYARSVDELSEGTTVTIPESPIRLTVEDIYQNAAPITDDENGRRVVGLEPLPPADEPSGNRRGMSVRVTSGSSEPIRLHLLGAANTVSRIEGAAGTGELTLRPFRYDLPFTLRLEEFQPEFYPRSDIPRSFTSRVTVMTQNVERQATISMNEPLRHSGYTVYQSSYAQTDDGSYVSVFAVVRNPARSLPYVVSVLVSMGLILHFFIVAAGTRGRSRSEVPAGGGRSG